MTETVPTLTGRLGRVLNVRPGEARVVGLAVAVSFLSFVGLMIGGSGIEALFFARYGVSRLPVMYLVLGTTMFLVSLGVGVLVGRTSRGRACLLVPLGIAVAAAVGRIALGANVSWMPQALWILQAMAQFLVGWSVWGLAGIVSDTRQAKRFFPLIGAGSVLGQVVGGLVTHPLASALGTANLVLVWVVSLLLVVGVGARLLVVGGAGLAGLARRGRAEQPLAQLTEGLRTVRRSPLMMWMAIASILFSLLFFSLYLPFSRAATTRYPNPDDLAGFFGLFFGVATGVAFLLSLLVTNRLLARLGVPIVMLVLPLLYVAAFGTLTVTATFVVIAAFRFAQVAWMQGGAVSSWEAVINTVPASQRDQTRAFLYGGPTQVGTILAGIVALVGETAFSPRALYAIGLASAVVATWAMFGARRAYPRELVRALRAGRPTVFDAEATGAAPFATLASDRSANAVAIDALRDPDAGVRRVAAYMLGETGSAEAAAALVTALGDEDAGVRANAVRSLAQAGDRDTPAALAEGLSDPDRVVRLAALDAAATAGPGSEAAVLAEVRPLLRDGDSGVRARAAAVLVARTGDAEALATLKALIANPDDGARAAAYQALDGLRSPVLFDLARVGLDDPVAIVRSEAAGVLGSLDEDRGRSVLVAALRDPDRREVALAALERLPHDGAGEPDLHAFAAAAVAGAVERHREADVITGDGDERLALLRDSLLADADRQATVALRAAALLGEGRDLSVAIQSLSVTDPAQRANALEVIDSVGARDLVRPLLSMWDGAPARGDAGAVLARLGKDPDGWIRACAAFATEGGSMSETVPALSSMDRVLFLRKVNLFEALAPQDLGPIAAIAQERSFADDEPIADQGEPGDEMFIIVSGSVEVMVRGDDGVHRVSTRSAGDVVGEMAVVTHEPRMASLVAHGDVRLLAIDRGRFEAILRERPETALAVIHVLSRRLAEAERTKPEPAHPVGPEA